MNTSTMPTRSSRAGAVTRFSVDITDGDGHDVAGEPVTARFRLEDGSEVVVHQTTDVGGRARFVEADEPATVDVVIEAGRETLGPLHPTAGARLVVEM